MHNVRNSRSQMFFKISVLKNFANFTGKHLGWNLFLIKCRPEGVLKVLRNFLIPNKKPGPNQKTQITKYTAFKKDSLAGVSL